jgi:parallel beta-helix repeat protein
MASSRLVRCLVFCAVVFVPRAASAQTLSVNPNSLTLSATAGTNVAPRTVQVTTTRKNLRWSVIGPAVNWLTVAPTSGNDAATVTLTFATAALAPGNYATSFSVQPRTGTAATVSVTLTIRPKLTISCPANRTVISPNGSAVVVTYTVTTSGGVAPVTVTGTPASGSSFAVGTTTVTVTARSSDGQTASCTFTVTVVRQLTVTCPANMTVSSPNGSPVPVSYSVTTSGGLAPVTVTGTPASGSNFAVGTTTVSVTARSSDGQTATCSFTVTVTTTSSSTLTVTCPANKTIASPNGFPVAVNYTVTTSGGVAPVTVTGNPPSGSNFPVGTTIVYVTARSSDGQTASCTFTVTVTYTPPNPPPGTYGPQNVPCPSGAFDIFPGQSIQAAVDNNVAATTFCIKAGVHSITASIIPKSGDVFVGEYGAILDGSGWTTTDANQGAFRAHDCTTCVPAITQDIDNVTIRNLVIRNMPQRGIHAFLSPDHWIVEFNDIGPAKVGVMVSSGSIVRNNFIHGNTNGGYLVWKAADVLFQANQFAYNGPGQKILATSNVTFRGNWSHHNNDGIWFDTENTSSLIEGNLVEDNWRNGIFYEVSSGATIRNNVIRRSNDSGIILSTAKNVEVYGNTLEDNFRGIQLFLNCSAVGGGTLKYDLTNDFVHDNSIKVGTKVGSWANTLNSLSSCTATQVAPYVNGLKNLTFDRNTYTVPSVDGQYWLWGYQAFKYWNEWQAIPQDPAGTVK